jgi:hypothetical protein
MKHHHLLVFLFLLLLSGITKAENPWGPECKTLDECIAFIRAPSSCKDDDYLCKNNEQADPLQGGLRQEFEKFGEAAVAPLFEILSTGHSLEVARAAEVLSFNQNHKPEDALAIQTAWRRMPNSSMNMLVSNVASPAFAREIMERLRKNPADGNAAHVFSNFREFEGEPPNGLTAAITEHVECSKGENCNSAFAKIQFDWISSNAELRYAGTKMAEVLQNPQVEETAKLAALGFFRPSDYFRTTDQMKNVAVPTLRLQLSSPFRAVQLQAASFLAGYQDTAGADVLLRLAEDANFERRKEALIALAGIGTSLHGELDRIRGLLLINDMDVRRQTVILLGAIGGDAVIDDLIGQIDPKDWLTTYSAVDALREYEDERAQLALEKVSESYWHPTVRDAARQPLTRASNLQQLPKSEVNATKFADAVVSELKSPIHERQDFEISNWCKSRFEKDGYHFVPDFITGPQVVEQGTRASNHNSKHFKKMLLQREDMKSAVQPGLELVIAGWKLKGTAIDPNLQGEYGDAQGQLVAERPGSSIQILNNQNITGLFLWNSKPHVMTGGLRFRSHGMLYRLDLSKQGIWSANPVLRLTGTTQEWTFNEKKSEAVRSFRFDAQSQVWISSEQSLGILGGDGAMIVQANGEPSWLGCGIPSFP